MRVYRFLFAFSKPPMSRRILGLYGTSISLLTYYSYLQEGRPVGMDYDYQETESEVKIGAGDDYIIVLDTNIAFYFSY
jgi:hypothetical protein